MKHRIIRLTLIVVGTLFIFKFILIPVRISGQSMEPNYHNGGFVFVNRLPYFRHAPSRGDVVAIRLSGTSMMYLKRIIGLPGEVLEIKKGVVLINSSPLQESYIIERDEWQIEPIMLAPGEYYVIGDNRRMPSDGHLFGRVENKRIIGRALW
ncbi:MAG: signal peptidase I [Patescibacteria group bacterium]